VKSKVVSFFSHIKYGTFSTVLTDARYLLKRGIDVVFGLFRFVEKCYELFSSDFEEEFVVDRERNRETLEGLAIPLAIRSVEG
jgi:hypothetical protein